MGMAKTICTKAVGLQCCLLFTLPVQAMTIDTTQGWTGGGYLFCSDCYYGQVFTAPKVENVLDSYTFFLSTSNPIISFKTEIVQWNSETFQSGSILYSSEQITNAGFPVYNGTRFGYASVTFIPSEEIALIPDEQYVAYLRTEPGIGMAAIGNNFDIDAYSGGYHLFGSPSKGWYNANDTRDYAFQASFSASHLIPEPPFTLGIVIMGLLELKLLFFYKMNRRVTD